MINDLKALVSQMKKKKLRLREVPGAAQGHKAPQLI